MCFFKVNRISDKTNSSVSVTGFGAGFAGASALGYVVGGAAYGAFSGASFAVLAGGNPMNGLWKGALTGSVGGFASGAFGGDIGAFVGGSVFGAIGTALNNGSEKDILLNSLLGGILSVGAYKLNAFYNYSNNYEGDLNYWGYHKASAAYARANFWEAEASWYELEGGGVSKIRYGKPFGKEAFIAQKAPPNAKYLSHTHARFGKGFEFPGPTDMERYQSMSGDFDFKTYGYKNSYSIN